jgi:transposase-like protein
MKCPACKTPNWRTYSQIMQADRFTCERCGRLLPFDKKKWERASGLTDERNT